MKNINKILNQIENVSISQPENIELLDNYLKDNKTITFFSWKLFDIKLNSKGLPKFNNVFNVETANKYISKEIKFIDLLIRNNIKFKYIKIIPNELPIYFWGKVNDKSKIFKTQINKYFGKIYKNTITLLFSDFLNDKKTKGIYNKVFSEVLKNFDSIVESSKLTKEMELRSLMYSKIKLPKSISKDLAKKAFALFAAEIAVLFYLQKRNILKNIVLLAGKRSVDTSKYEFYKFPKNRPVLPKLFVI